MSEETKKEGKRVAELTYIGCNDYDKPIYKTAGGRLFVDAEPDNEDAPLYALSGNKVDGEPEVALRNINGFEDVEIVFTPRRINFRDPVHKALYFKRLYGEGEDNE